MGHEQKSAKTFDSYLQAHMVLSGVRKKLSLVHTRSFCLFRSCRKKQKTKTKSLSPLSSGSFCMPLTTQKTQCEPGFRKRCCLQEVPL